MHLFSDREKRTYLVIYILISLLAVGGGYYFGGSAGAIWAFFCCLFFLLVFYGQLRRRVLLIKQFNADLNRVLHGAERLEWDQYTEGELAVLQNEIRKLTLELRDRAAALDREKKELADSMADISHQLRTPLTSVNLILSLLKKPDLSEEQRLETVRDLQRMMQRMDWLINALLKMSRLESNTATFKKEPVSVRQLVQRAAEPLEIPMELKGQRLILELEDVFFEGDFSWSVEAIGNILKNCMEHTPTGGTIVVSAAENPLCCKIVIRDNGKGIDPADLPHLFERFYRGKNADSQSIGIGLALSRMILSRQNGTVKAENHSQGGACFTIQIYKGVV
ncbi:MAG: HAMP domain-containing histidine kinase [Clostridia bacterium]|nr:HAMP domain-containing histidine kinase [Clostridia bacterium]